MVAGLGLPLRGSPCRDVQPGQGSSCDFSCPLHGMKPNSSGVRNPPRWPCSALNFSATCLRGRVKEPGGAVPQLTLSGSFMAGLHFPAVFLPLPASSGANGAAGGLSLGGRGEPTPQWVAVINGAGVRKQPASYPGNPAVFPGLQGCVGLVVALMAAQKLR